MAITTPAGRTAVTDALQVISGSKKDSQRPCEPVSFRQTKRQRLAMAQTFSTFDAGAIEDARLSINHIANEENHSFVSNRDARVFARDVGVTAVEQRLRQ